ncbi:RNA polymerase subunit sigma [Pseudomonas aeruginosa]|uniref:RNA polymerase sigma factor n=1 Tax=Pseudomonas aeruginosa TaxID=287 RepID=UPI000EF6470D|nr:RNA polymerase sigma factor [Pseudomonas aeruginosa]RLR52327.1 RNA polymerase subunit sigma [Pseudomonas aeruginosa]
MASDKPMAQKISCAYQSTYGQLVRFFQKRTGNCHDADDLSQDVFTLWLNRKEQTPVQEQRAFLFKIANHVLIDHWRKNQKQKNIYQDDYEVEEATQHYTTELDPGCVLEHQQRLMLLNEALTLLPPRRREAFVLYRFDGLSQSEIAERMEISISMVEKHIAAALLHCKRYVDAGQKDSSHDE